MHAKSSSGQPEAITGAARASPPPTELDETLASLRKELGGEKMSKLRRRAADNVGVTEEQLDQIDDAHEPREALIELVLGHRRQQLAEEAENEAAPALGPTTEVHMLRQELGAMKSSELRRRAIGDGIGEAAVEEAGDEDDAKAAFVKLICAAAAARTSSQKSDGGAAAEAKAVTAEATEVLHRAELAGLKMSTLRKQVKEAGVEHQAIEEADDADDARAAMIELLLASQQSKPGSALDALLQELGALKLGALRKRAQAAGADHDVIDEIYEDENPKDGLVALIVAATTAASGPCEEELAREAQEATAPADLAAAGKLELPSRQLRRELEGLRLTALQRRAAAEGVGEEQLAAAVDSDDPKAELIALLLDSHAAAAGATDVRVAALRRELEGLKMTALQRRASAEGHSEEALEGAVDCENPRAALIELLAAGPPLAAARPVPDSDAEQPAAPTSSKVAKPHFGAPPDASRQAIAAEPVVVGRPTHKGQTRTKKHVMLSVRIQTGSQLRSSSPMKKFHVGRLRFTNDWHACSINGTLKRRSRKYTIC